MSLDEKNNELFNISTSKQGTSSTTDLMGYLSLAEKERVLSQRYTIEKAQVLEKFLSWTEHDQTDFVKLLLQKMCHHQHSQIDQYLKPMLQRNFIILLPEGIAEHVLSLLDAKSLCASACVSKAWNRAIAHGMLWRKLIERKVRTNSMWRGLSEKRGWKHFLFVSKEQATYLIALARNKTPAEAQKLQRTHPDPHEYQHSFYRELYPQIVRDICMIENNWRQGKHCLQRINCESENSKGVYCLQYDDDKVISGLRDNTIKCWKRSGLTCTKTLTGHTGSVLCLQYDDQIIASGSSDATVRIWDVKTGAQLNTLIHHGEAVLHLRFQNGMLVTCSKDRSIAVWDMVSPQEINMRRVLVGHRAAVNVVDFDETYIVSASGDRTIKVWSADTCEFVKTLSGHRRGIACLQYRNRLIVSGSSDYSIRLWDIECGNCLRVLEGHEELVRCIRFDSKRIVSGAYDGKIKVWDLQAALDPRTPPSNICIRTLSEHTGRVFRLQFDEFQIVSSSHDDTILIWDFFNVGDNSTFQHNGNGPSNPPGPTHSLSTINDGTLHLPVLPNKSNKIPNSCHFGAVLPHNCAPGPSNSRTINNPILNLQLSHAPSSSPSLLLDNSSMGYQGAPEMMDVQAASSFTQPFELNFENAGPSFRSQSLGQISQHARFQPSGVCHSNQHQPSSHLLRISQQKNSSCLQDMHQQQPVFTYQQLSNMFNPSPKKFQNFSMADNGDAGEDSEQEGIVMAVAASIVNNNSGEEAIQLNNSMVVNFHNENEQNSLTDPVVHDLSDFSKMNENEKQITSQNENDL